MLITVALQCGLKSESMMLSTFYSFSKLLWFIDFCDLICILEFVCVYEECKWDFASDFHFALNMMEILTNYSKP